MKVFTIYGPRNHLGYMTRNSLSNFHPNITWRLHTKFGFERRSVFEEKNMKMLYLSDLRQRSMNGLS